MNRNDAPSELPLLNESEPDRQTLVTSRTRLALDYGSATFAWSSALIISGLFLWLVVTVVGQGYSALSWEFISQGPSDAGRAGGILPMIVSTCLIVGTCLCVSLPLGIGTAIYLAEVRGDHETDSQVLSIRWSLDVLAGIPSIVFGLFGNAFFCQFLRMGDSILAGGLTLACMVLPLFIRIAEQGIREVPQAYRLSAAALGLSRATTLRQVILPAAAPAIAAGAILGMARALSETAALIFTSGYSMRMPASLLDSGRSLSVHIYDMALNVTGGDERAFATASLLVLILLVINTFAVTLTRVASRWMTGQGSSKRTYTMKGIR